MNIAMVVSTFPPDSGGMGQVAYEEALRLARRGNSVTGYTLHSNNHRDTSGMPFIITRLFGMPRFGDGGVVPSLIWRLRRADLVHLHFPFYGAGLFTFLACWFFRKPLIVTYHMDARPTSWLKRLVQGPADFLAVPLIFRAARKIITPDVGYFQSSGFNCLVRPNILMELANGVDTNVFAPGEADWSKLRPDWRHKNILLFVGNLLSVKRLDIILFSLSQSAKQDEVLVVVGGGYEEKSLRKEATRLALEDRVYFAGKCSDRVELANYYRLATVVIISSDRESFSLVALEAMATGKPIIGSDIPALHNRVVGSGLLFQPGSAASLRVSLDIFYNLSIDERKLMGETGRRTVIQKYDWDGHVADLEKCYASVL